MYFNSNQIDIIKEYLKKNNPQLYRAVLLIYSCAIRPGELRYIKVMDVCVEDDFIQLNGEFTKNGNSVKVFMSEQVKKELEILRAYPAHYYIFGKNGYPSSTMIAENVLNNQHRAMLKELGIRGHYALYSWKHTGAVAMVRAGINLKLIQLHFRHAKLETTNEYLKNLGIMDNMELKIKMPRL